MNNKLRASISEVRQILETDGFESLTPEELKYFDCYNLMRIANALEGIQQDIHADVGALNNIAGSLQEAKIY